MDFGYIRLQNAKKKKYLTRPVKYKPRHEISNNVACAISKASAQPVRMRSPIRVFASRLNI